MSASNLAAPDEVHFDGRTFWIRRRRNVNVEWPVRSGCGVSVCSLLHSLCLWVNLIIVTIYTGYLRCNRRPRGAFTCPIQSEYTSHVMGECPGLGAS